MIKLEILVTQYKETDDIVRNLLDSIELQVGVSKDEIRVIIVNDGSDVFLTDELFSRYNYKIDYIKASHGGISAARNVAMASATAPYIMFCDCDDMFYNMFALKMIFDKMNKFNDSGNLGFDILTSHFWEEVGENCKELEFHEDYYNTFIHGKVYNLAFLRRNHIKWDDEIQCHEDVYFNCLALNISINTVTISKPFYLWKYRKGSITRNDDDFEVKSFPELLKSFSKLIDEALRRGLTRVAKSNAASGLYMFYFFTNRIKNPDSVEKCERLITDYWKKYKYLVEKVDKEERIKLLLTLRKSFYEQGLDFEKISFNDWIKRIENYE